MDGYTLRLLSDNSTIFVPRANAESVGIRPIISLAKAKQLLRSLADDFEEISCDWKHRSREFAQKLHSGDIFEAADVLKKLTFLSHEKKLSFREQTHAREGQIPDRLRGFECRPQSEWQDG